jgi:hypothetical protein
MKSIASSGVSLVLKCEGPGAPGVAQVRPPSQLPQKRPQVLRLRRAARDVAQDDRVEGEIWISLASGGHRKAAPKGGFR